MNKRVLTSVLLCMLLIGNVLPAAASASGYEQAQGQKACITKPMVELKENMRELWMNHIMWTRSYIVSALSNLEDQKVVLARLLQNQQDIGNAIKPYYGEAAGDKLAGLLREHILLAGKIIDAVKAGNQAEVAKYNKEWYRNADDIAKFLSAANPNWSYDLLKDMMYKHLELVTGQVTTRVKKDWPASITVSDQNEDHMIRFADILTEGIIKQFPEKFK